MTEETDNKIMGGILFFIVIFAILVYSFYANALIWGIIVFGILGASFWVWMLIDCIKNEPGEGNDKLIWVIIIVFAHLIGAAIYSQKRNIYN